MQSLFTPLAAEGLTTLLIRYDWRTDHVRFYCAKEWDADHDFSKYNKTFFRDSILTDDTKYLNTNDVWALFAKHGLKEYLESIVQLLRQGRNFGINCFYNQKYNIHHMSNIHSVLRGVNNKHMFLLTGGIRRHPLEDQEYDVIVDGLNLSRAMTFKNTVIEIPHGGHKATVHMDPIDLENMEQVGFLSYCIDRTHTTTGPDMFFPPELADVANANFTCAFNGGPGGSLGATGKPTVYGTYLALKEAVRSVTGSPSLDGMKFAIMGLGACGWNLAHELSQEKVELIVCDVDQAKIDSLIAAHPNTPITVVGTDEILNVEADAFCPCAMGGIITKENIPSLKFKYIIGATNNQLAAHSQEEEIALARMLADRGIIFCIDWWHNVGGMICGIEEVYKGKYDAKYEDVIKWIDEIVPRKMAMALEESKKLGITPTEYAYKVIEEIIYPAL